MRAGLVASIAGHAVILLWGLVAFPSAKPFFVEPIDALPVDLVPLEDVTKTKVGERAAPKNEQPAPEPSKKPVESKVEADKPGKTKQAAKPAPAKQEPRKVATVAPESEPPPAPEREPETKIEPPSPQAEPAPPMDPAPQEAEKAPEPPKPVDVVPQSKPTPPKRTRTAAVRKNTSPRARDAPEKKFDPNEISNLLNKVDPSGGEQIASERPAGLGTDKATQDEGLSASDIDLLISKIKSRWNYIPDTFPPDLVVTVQFQLTREGHLAGTPEVINSNPYPRFQQLAEAAVRAIMAVDRSEGFSFLPLERYDGNGGWNTVLANLRPQ